MAPNEESNAQRWASRLASGSPDAQVEALRMISHQESVTGFAVPVVRLAGSHDDEVRMWSAEALESAIKPDSSDVPQLIRFLQSQAGGETCYWAATMLGRLGTQAVPAVAALDECVNISTCLAVRERAVWALSQIGPSAATAIPTLQALARSAPPRLRRLADLAIARITNPPAVKDVAA